MKKIKMTNIDARFFISAALILVGLLLFVTRAKYDDTEIREMIDALAKEQGYAIVKEPERTTRAYWKAWKVNPPVTSSGSSSVWYGAGGTCQTTRDLNGNGFTTCN